MGSTNATHPYPSKLRGTPTRLLLAVGGEGGVPPLSKLTIVDLNRGG
jgi:hypothetical protein